MDLISVCLENLPLLLKQLNKLIFYSGFIFCIIFMDITSIELIRTHILVLFALFTILEFRVDRVTF
jgi:hypothetical protein